MGLAVQNVLMAFGDLLDLAPQTLRDYAEIPLGLFEFVIDSGKPLVDPGKLLIDPGKPPIDSRKLLIDPGKSLINGAEHSLQEFSRLFVHLVPREIVENPQALPYQAFKSAHYGLLVPAGDQGASIAFGACSVRSRGRAGTASPSDSHELTTQAPAQLQRKSLSGSRSLGSRCRNQEATRSHSTRSDTPPCQNHLFGGSSL